MKNQKSNKNSSSELRPRVSAPRMPGLTSAHGVALVAVLSILVVLAILASTLAVIVNIEQKSAQSQFESQRVNLLIDSGIEHAKVLIELSKNTDSKPGMANIDYLLNTFGVQEPVLNAETGDSLEKNAVKHKWRNFCFQKR